MMRTLQNVTQDRLNSLMDELDEISVLVEQFKEGDPDVVAPARARLAAVRAECAEIQAAVDQIEAAREGIHSSVRYQLVPRMQKAGAA